MRNCLISAVFVFLPLTLQSAIPEKKMVYKPSSSLISTLQLPRKNRLISLSKNPQSLEFLHQLALDNTQSLQVRWRAITTMGELSPTKAQTYLEKLLVHREWYLRNASMIAISHSERPTVIKWAAKLLEDKSLMVRTSAVQAIKKVKGVELQDLLWEKLNSPENFHKGKSLWIRKYIADTLSLFAEKGDEEKFMKLLLDEDKRLHPFAIRGLHISTGKNLAPNRALHERRLAWIQHYKKNIQ